MGFGAGQGVKCYHSEHLYGELWHRAFIVAPDTPRARYVISCGNNAEASAGVAGVWRQADARARGLKRVQVEPHLSVTGAVSAEWVPIRPKTDAAFLYALLHRIVHEREWREVCDVAFLEESTNAPYLVGPNGYFLRDPESRRPLLFDLDAERAVPLDAIEGRRPALDGVRVAAGVEEGPDGEEWEHEAAEARPAFQVFLDHVRGYTPEWAEGESDVPAGTIRRIADEFLAHACGRRDHRDRGAGDALPPRCGPPRQGGEQRLGRVSLLLGADHARGPRRGPRGPGRRARDRGQAQPPRGQPAQERAADARRLHGLPLQPDEPPGVEPPPGDPERLPHDGPPRRQLPVVAGPRPGPPPVALPEAGPRQVAARDPPGDVDQLPHQPVHLLPQRAGGGRAGRGVPVHRLVRLHPRRDELDGRLPPAGGDGPREPPAHPHRFDQVHRAVLEPAGLGGAPAGRRPGGGREGHDRHRDRARGADRPPRALQPGHQPGRGGDAARDRGVRLLARRLKGPLVRGRLGRGGPGREPRSHRRRRWSGSTGSARTASSSVPTPRWSGSSIRP